MKKVTKRINVRYGETDQMGVVYHANYIVYFEDARTAFVESLGFPYKGLEDAGYLSPVVSVTCEYGAPLRYGDEACVVVWVDKLTKAKVTYRYEVYASEDAVGVAKPNAKGESVHCLVEKDTFRPVNMKTASPSLYQAYEAALAEGE